MKAETYLSQIRKIDTIIANREADRYADAEGIAELKKRRQAIITTLENLTLREYRVLYEIFVNGLLVKQVPAKLGVSYRWVKEVKRQALDHLQEVLNEREGVQ